VPASRSTTEHAAPPVAIVFPSGEKATAWTAPGITRVSFKEPVSNRRIVLDWFTASVLPSGE
jgi:hypothetical protein